MHCMVRLSCPAEKKEHTVPSSSLLFPNQYYPEPSTPPPPLRQSEVWNNLMLSYFGCSAGAPIHAPKVL